VVGLTLDVDRHIGKRILQWYHLIVSNQFLEEERRRTNDSTDVTDDSSFGGVETRKFLGSLEVDGVEILASM
jgi:hypothetical protein